MTSKLQLTRDQIEDSNQITEQDVDVYKDIERFVLIFEREGKFYAVNAARNNYEGTDYGEAPNPYNNRNRDDIITVAEVFKKEVTVIEYS